MFTIDQIQAIHAKVKSGADFPQYIRDLIALGVSHYDTFVFDGHSVFYGNEGYKLVSPSKYDSIVVSDGVDSARFEKRLKIHQNGGSDYPTFCKDAAENGVEKWIVDMASMTCKYFDKAGNLMLAESIPS